MSSTILRPTMIRRVILANARFMSTAPVRPVLGFARSAAAQQHAPDLFQHSVTARYISKEARAKVDARTAAVKSSSTYEDLIKAIVAAQLGVDTEEVTNSKSFVDDLGADSLDTTELMIAFEDEFAIDIPDKEAEKITNVQAAINYVEQMVGGKR